MMQKFPEVKELNMLLMMYKFLKTVNKKRPQVVFNTLVAEKYSQDIIQGNIDVFLSDSFSFGNQEMWNGLKNKFKDVDPESRQAIHNYLLALLACNKKCLDIKC